MSPFKRLFLAACLALAALAPFASLQAKEAADLAADPVAEKRLMEISAELRCLVCQGQSIADSDADMAGDMRSLVRQRIAAGDNATQVRDWLVARYGDYVTYDPPMSAVTLPLWLTPIALLAIGIWIARSSFRRRRRRHK